MNDTWLASRTVGAPAVLRQRVELFLESANGDTVADQLAAGAIAALQVAAEGAASRPAALDLLAADAIITLALLERALYSPGTLALDARKLRRMAAPS